MTSSGVQSAPDKYQVGEVGYTVPLPDDGPKPQRLTSGKAKGRLVGGNLSLISATIGTPYEIEADGNILLLEDTGEKGYRVDRLNSLTNRAGDVIGKIVEPLVVQRERPGS